MEVLKYYYKLSTYRRACMSFQLLILDFQPFLQNRIDENLLIQMVRSDFSVGRGGAKCIGRTSTEDLFTLNE